MTVESYWLPLQKALESSANADRAQQMERYMRNQFRFYGINATTVKELTSQFNKENKEATLSLPDKIDWCWKQPQREWQYIGQQQLYRWRKAMKLSDGAWLEQLTLSKPWWDTVDFLSSNIWGYYFSQYPTQRERLVSKWLKGGEMWMQRVALLYQLKYKEKTDLKALQLAIETLNVEQDFFIRKAIGWALRQYAKIDPDWVKEYVAVTELSGLSKREALKNLT